MISKFSVIDFFSPLVSGSLSPPFHFASLIDLNLLWRLDSENWLMAGTDVSLFVCFAFFFVLSHGSVRFSPARIYPCCSLSVTLSAFLISEPQKCGITKTISQRQKLFIERNFCAERRLLIVGLWRILKAASANYAAALLLKRRDDVFIQPHKSCRLLLFKLVERFYVSYFWNSSTWEEKRKLFSLWSSLPPPSTSLLHAA